jgi:hypothetical protein
VHCIAAIHSALNTNQALPLDRRCEAPDVIQHSLTLSRPEIFTIPRLNWQLRWKIAGARPVAGVISVSVAVEERFSMAEQPPQPDMVAMPGLARPLDSDTTVRALLLARQVTYHCWALPLSRSRPAASSRL